MEIQILEIIPIPIRHQFGCIPLLAPKVHLQEIIRQHDQNLQALQEVAILVLVTLLVAVAVLAAEVLMVAEEHQVVAVEEDKTCLKIQPLLLKSKTMKKYFLGLLIGLSMAFAQAQDITDALRFSQDNLVGTARFRAMGGAFGAVGGDFSAINVNPAGSVIFANNQVGLTLSTYNTKNKSKYFGKNNTENSLSLDLNQAGGVFTFRNVDNKSDWKKFSLALNYENANNFDNNIFTSGKNPTNSIGNYFSYYANANGGVSLNNLQLQSGENITSLYDYLGVNYGYGDQQAFLGYQSFIINPAVNYDENTNRDYVSLIPSGGNYYQENSFVSSGYNGKLAFNFAAQYKDQLYFGVNLNSHFTDYRQTTSFYESNTNSPNAGVQRLQFDNELHTYGNGFSFQLGAIAKLSKEFRVGLSIDSPTWYELYDELTQGLKAISAASTGELPTDKVYPNVINIYAPYTLQTPSKMTGSLAYIFGKQGLISIDYAIKDYSNTKYRPKNDFSGVNNSMSNLLAQTAELRIGAEYRMKEWSLRGGYRMEQSPYKNKDTMGDLSGYSAGFGYNFGVTRLDFAYALAKRDYKEQFFSKGFTDNASVNSSLHTMTVTLLFEL